MPGPALWPGSPAVPLTPLATALARWAGALAGPTLSRDDRLWAEGSRGRLAATRAKSREAWLAVGIAVVSCLATPACGRGDSRSRRPSAGAGQGNTSRCPSDGSPIHCARGCCHPQGAAASIPGPTLALKPSSTTHHAGYSTGLLGRCPGRPHIVQGRQALDWRAEG